jgi:glycine betaine/proline transport system substrate-binding protein
MNTLNQVTLVTIDLSFHVASAGAVISTLARHGISVREIRAPHQEAFERFAAGEGDLLCAAWLPGSHGVYLDPIEQQVERLGVLYEPYAIWAVPDYVPVEEVSVLSDLAKPAVAARMQKLIQGIGPGAGISRFSREIVERYRLDELGYHFENGTLAQCIQAFETAAQSGSWVVVPLWHPQFLHRSWKLRELEDPLGLLRGKDQATLIGRKASLEKLPTAAVEDLKIMSLGNRVVTELDYQISQQGVDPRKAFEAIAVPPMLG